MMKNSRLLLLATVFILGVASLFCLERDLIVKVVEASCSPLECACYYQVQNPTYYLDNTCYDSAPDSMHDLAKQDKFTLIYRSSTRYKYSAVKHGECGPTGSTPQCWPQFYGTSFTDPDPEEDVGAFWQDQINEVYRDNSCQWDTIYTDHAYSNTSDTFTCFASPIIVDVLGNGFQLTDLANGVSFDIDGNGAGNTISWTAAESDDAWLVLDRNNNGTIDWGQELFGNFTDQPKSEEPQGFLALAVFDTNQDKVIDQLDPVFTQLRLWQDVNHDGVSQPHELHPLAELDVTGFELKFKESKKVDEFGNSFRYRAKVRGTTAGRWAWDVFLLL